jgi:hypothetical protein
VTQLLITQQFGRVLLLNRKQIEDFPETVQQVSTIKTICCKYGHDLGRFVEIIISRVADYSNMQLLFANIFTANQLCKRWRIVRIGNYFFKKYYCLSSNFF